MKDESLTDKELKDDIKQTLEQHIEDVAYEGASGIGGHFNVLDEETQDEMLDSTVKVFRKLERVVIDEQEEHSWLAIMYAVGYLLSSMEVRTFSQLDDWELFVRKGMQSDNEDYQGYA